MTGRARCQWSLTAAVIAVFVAIGLASYIGTASSARAQTKGEVVAEFEGVPATFSGGNPEFSVVYDIKIVALPDGTATAIFNQRGSDDVLRGTINETGIPPVLSNPGKEKMTGGRMRNDRTLTYGYYEYVSQGQTSTWSSVVFTLPSGALPFPGPSTVEEGGDETVTPPPEETEQEPAAPAPGTQDESGIPTGLIVAIVGGIAALAGGALAYARRNGKGGCDEERARWQAAEALHDEAIKAESDARYDKEMQQAAFDRTMTARAVAKAEVLGKHVEQSAYTEAMEEWEAKAPEYDARVEQEQAKLDAAKAAHEAATERREELDAKRQEARRIYEECIGQAAALASAASVAGSSVASGPAPLGATQTRGCKENTTGNWRVLSRSSVKLVIDFEVRAVPQGVHGSYQDAEALAASLDEIAETLEELSEGKLPGKAGQLQDLQDKAKSLRDKAKTLADKGVGGLLEEELKGAIKEQQERINSKLKEAVNSATGLVDAFDALTKVPDLLKEPYKIPIEILRFTADLGSKVALFGGRVAELTDMYSVEARLQTLQIDILWRSYEICVNGRWKIAYEVLAPSGPTEWQGWRKIGEFPGRGSGQDLDRGLATALGWCQGQMNSSSEELSKAMNSPPSGR